MLNYLKNYSQCVYKWKMDDIQFKIELTDNAILAFINGKLMLPLMV
jgi:hypothetical protein